MNVKGDHQAWVYLGKMVLMVLRLESTSVDKMVFVVARHRRLDCKSSAKESPCKLRMVKGGHQAWVHLGKMVLMVVRRIGWTAWAAAKDSQGISDFRQPREHLNGQTGSLTGRDNLLFSEGDEWWKLLQMKMMRWGPQWATDLCGSSKEVLRNLMFELRI
jgi:hypothetical protein